MIRVSSICRVVSIVICACSFLFNVVRATAETFPSRLIRIVVPMTVGTPVDVISRMIANDISDAEGWKVIVENRPGAIGTIAGMHVLGQPADGYTIFAAALPVAAEPALLANMSYQLEADFEPLIKLTSSYNVLIVNPSLPVNSMADLVEYLKTKSGNHNFSSGGFGTPAHLIGEMFKLQTGVPVTHIPYSSLPQATGDLINGNSQFMFITTMAVVGLIDAGQLRALAVTAPHRIAALEQVPSVAEEGFKNLVVEDWVGLLVKTGTPADIVVRLNVAINKSLKKPSVQEALAKIGAESAGGTAEAFGALFKEQIAHWGKVVKDSGIRM